MALSGAVFSPEREFLQREARGFLGEKFGHIVTSPQQTSGRVSANVNHRKEASMSLSTNIALLGARACAGAWWWTRTDSLPD
jgi:hypothetical protein